jgi:hypothetical protein
MKKANLLLRSILFLIFFACSSEQIDEESTTPRQYTLTITVSEGGSVSPAASGKYNEGATITITATPKEGYKFERWEGSDFDDNPCNFSGPFNCRTAVTMDSDREIKVFFEKIK